MVALDLLDKGREDHSEAVLVPAVELSADGERNLEAEISAFVNRPVHSGREDTPRSKHTSIDVGAGTGRTPFSEVAGFYDTGF